MFYDVRETLKDGAMINIIVSKRNTGKTWSSVRYIWNEVVQKGQHFIYLRRNKVGELDIAKDKVFSSIPECTVINRGYKYYNVKYGEDDKEIQEECGYALALSTVGGVRGINLEKVSCILFDEFTITEPGKHYLQGEFIRFAILLETIVRLRNDVKVIMLGNTYNFYNPYTIGWNISLAPNQYKWTSKNRRITYRYIVGDQYNAREQSAIAELFAGTIYDEWAGKGVNIANNGKQIAKKPGNAHHYFSILYDDKKFTVWVARTGMYISNSNGNSPVVFNLSKSNLAAGEQYFKRQRNEIQRLRNYFEKGLLFYESEKIKSAFIEILAYITSF